MPCHNDTWTGLTFPGPHLDELLPRITIVLSGISPSRTRVASLLLRISVRTKRHRSTRLWAGGIDSLGMSQEEAECLADDAAV